MQDFIPGIKLAGKFYQEAVRPILESDFPDVPYSAALIGSGSEVLGFDTEMSTDHHWGPRALLFLRERDHERFASAINESLRQKLPVSFCSYSTNYSEPDPHDNHVQHLQEVENGPVNHRVEIHTMRGFFLDYLGFDLDQVTEPPDWLTFPEQKLRTIVATWEKIRPAQLVAADPKTGEMVHYLFCYRGLRLGASYLNKVLIPLLCRKAGVPESDAPRLLHL